MRADLRLSTTTERSTRRSRGDADPSQRPETRAPWLQSGERKRASEHRAAPTGRRPALASRDVGVACRTGEALGGERRCCKLLPAADAPRRPRPPGSHRISSPPTARCSPSRASRGARSGPPGPTATPRGRALEPRREPPARRFARDAPRTIPTTRAVRRRGPVRRRRRRTPGPPRPRHPRPSR